uniref:Uncharacterized protein n=1 Tax=Romanomermis culicivorax TaxID=13658 RepID=A0A915J8Z5_ROMCU
MGNFIIRISNRLVATVEANKARTRTRMEVIPEANKAKGDTIEEGLKEAIDAAGSSNSTDQQEQRAKGLGASLLTASSGRSDRGSRQVWETGLLHDLRCFAKELAPT